MQFELWIWKVCQVHRAVRLSALGRELVQVLALVPVEVLSPVLLAGTPPLSLLLA